MQKEQQVKPEEEEPSSEYGQPPVRQYKYTLANGPFFLFNAIIQVQIPKMEVKKEENPQEWYQSALDRARKIAQTLGQQAPPGPPESKDMTQTILFQCFTNKLF